MQVIFYGSDGAVINKEEQALKPGASISIVAKAPRGLLRATISIEAGVDTEKSGTGQLFTRLVALSVPIPVAKSQPVVVP